MIPVFENEKLWEHMESILASWHNTPYKHMGMTKQRGADCTMFLACCYNEAGVMANLYPPEYYPRDWNIHTGEELVRNSLIYHLQTGLAKGFTADIFEKKEIEREDFIRGDLLGFKTPRSKCTNHTAMWLGRDDWMVNCIQGGGVCELEWTRVWNRLFTTAFRIMVKE